MPDSQAAVGAEDILVIAPEGLKTFLRALGALQTLRKRHKDARITALVPVALFDFSRSCGCFDDVIAAGRGGSHPLPHWCGLFLKLNKKRFSRVYDLQGRYPAVLRHFLRGRPEWTPAPEATAPDISWMTAGVNEGDVIAAFGLEKPYVLLLAGVSPRHPEKAWPREYWSSRRFAALALRLSREGYQPVILGTDDDADAAERLLRVCPAARDLCGLTSLPDIAALAWGASGAIGNDTGATILVALTGCPTQIIDANVSVSAVYRDFIPRKEQGHAACGT